MQKYSAKEEMKHLLDEGYKGLRQEPEHKRTILSTIGEILLGGTLGLTVAILGFYILLEFLRTL